MNYGLNISASAALTSLYRQDVLANNLANIETPGFARVLPMTRQRDAARTEDNLNHLPSNDLLESLGAGITMADNIVSFAQGGIEETGRELDTAIMGEGFFTIDAGDDTTMLTRDGRFLASEGVLVHATSGRPVLDNAGSTIPAPTGAHISIGESGVVSVDNTPVAKLALVNVTTPSALVPAGNGLYSATDDMMNTVHDATGSIIAGAIERSSVDEIQAMMAVTSAARSIGTHMTMIRNHDKLLDRAINRLGRVS